MCVANVGLTGMNMGIGHCVTMKSIDYLVSAVKPGMTPARDYVVFHEKPSLA
jgi:hypothetical protein